MVTLGNCSCVALMPYIHVGTLSKSITMHISLLTSPLGAYQESDNFINVFDGE